jgi:hypothetical protein
MKNECLSGGHSLLTSYRVSPWQQAADLNPACCVEGVMHTPIVIDTHVHSIKQTRDTER